MLSCVSRFHPLDDSITPTPICDNQKCLLTLLNVSWGAKSPLVEDHWAGCQLRPFSAQTSTGFKAEKGVGYGPTHVGEATLALNPDKFPH